MSEREYTLTVTLKRTFKRKVQSAKHRAEVVRKIESFLRGEWEVEKATIRAGASKTQKAKTKVKTKARATVKKAERKEQKLGHISKSLPLREWMAELLHKEGKGGWTVKKSKRRGGGFCYYWRHLITVGPTNTSHVDGFSYARLKVWGAKQGIDLSKLNRVAGVFIHELAHACAGSPRQNGDGRTHHGKTFRRHYRRLLKKYAPQVFGLPVKDLRTIPTPMTMAAK
jgi:hypothetical protein